MLKFATMMVDFFSFLLTVELYFVTYFVTYIYITR